MTKGATYQVYLVGGAVRDELLGVPLSDRDYVVVGARPEQLLAQGFRSVGRDFPVFLHPLTKDEYALARIERKIASGYHGFSFYSDPDVTLEDDLARRDLTINAMAKDESGRLIDPFGGQTDLQAGILRHVSAAFTEDPVRILRLARFSARFVHFHVADETLALMRTMVSQGEVDALVPERIWQEISRGLMEAQPSRMFMVLQACGALSRILPELATLDGVPQPEKWHPEIDTFIHVMQVIDYAARHNQTLSVRFAALLHDLGKGQSLREYWPSHKGHEVRSARLVQEVCLRLKVPRVCANLAELVAREHGNITRALELRAATLVELFERSDAFRKPDRFHAALDASQADFYGRRSDQFNFDDRTYLPADFLPKMLQAAQMVPVAEIAQQTDAPTKIKNEIYVARVAAVEAAQKRYKAGLNS